MAGVKLTVGGTATSPNKLAIDSPIAALTLTGPVGQMYTGDGDVPNARLITGETPSEDLETSTAVDHQ